ncbi:MAG: hypothetical protein ACD_23C00742G0002, partial [uncultured bacterium]
FSSFIETSCLTGGKTHIVSPERLHTKSNAELGTERQPQAPMQRSGLVLPPKGAHCLIAQRRERSFAAP